MQSGRLMIGGKTCAAVAICFVFCVAADGAETQAVAPGAYEVRVSLELPNLDDMTSSRTATICITPDSGNAHGLVVLSENNPLGKCPLSNVRESGDTLTFDIACPGLNAAQGLAVYTLTGDAFRGRIAMKMGGKNMTMTESQAGRRVGDCAPKPPS